MTSFSSLAASAVGGLDRLGGSNAVDPSRGGLTSLSPLAAMFTLAGCGRYEGDRGLAGRWAAQRRRAGHIWLDSCSVKRAPAGGRPPPHPPRTGLPERHPPLSRSA